MNQSRSKRLEPWRISLVLGGLILFALPGCSSSSPTSTGHTSASQPAPSSTSKEEPAPSSTSKEEPAPSVNTEDNSFVGRFNAALALPYRTGNLRIELSKGLNNLTNTYLFDIDSGGTTIEYTEESLIPLDIDDPSTWVGKKTVSGKVYYPNEGDPVVKEGEAIAFNLTLLDFPSFSISSEYEEYVVLSQDDTFEIVPPYNLPFQGKIYNSLSISGGFNGKALSYIVVGYIDDDGISCAFMYDGLGVIA